MSSPGADKPAITFERSPVPGVPVEVVRYLLTLPDEVRSGLGNFLLDSTVEGFDGPPETSARLGKEELKRRIDDARTHPDKLLSPEQVFQDMEDHLAQLRRTPHPDH